MLLDHWNPEWNHLKEFWALIDTERVIQKANSHSREWFYMHSGKELIGYKYSVNPSSVFLKTENGWDIFLGISSFTGQPVEYRLKPVEGGHIGTIKHENSNLDLPKLQMRLDEARSNKLNKVMFS